MMPVIINKYAKYCAVCGCSVNVGEGYSQLEAGNRWLTYCQIHKPADAKTITTPAPVIPLTQKRVLAADGTITITPWTNDSNTLQLLRAMPGRQYHADTKVWI